MRKQRGFDTFHFHIEAGERGKNIIIKKDAENILEAQNTVKHLLGQVVCTHKHHDYDCYSFDRAFYNIKLPKNHKIHNHNVNYIYTVECDELCTDITE